MLGAVIGAAGMVSSASGADLGHPIASLDVCDALGLSGLTIASAENCLQISGGAAYKFKWGDYLGKQNIVLNFERNGKNFTIPEHDSVGGQSLDWESHVDAWLKFVGTAQSSFGPARAVIKLGYDDDLVMTKPGDSLTPKPPVLVETSLFTVDEAYVSIGETTILTAGLKETKGSIANFDDDAPYNWLGLFNSQNVDKGVYFSHGSLVDFLGASHPYDMLPVGGHVIQLTSDLGNGFFVGGALENLNDTMAARAGTAIGVLSYDNGSGFTGHFTALAGGVLDGTVEDWAIHTGFSAELDMVSLRGALAYDDNGFWNVLGSAMIHSDMFTLAGSVEGTSGHELGAGVSLTVDMTEELSVKAGFRWFDTDTTAPNNEAYQAAIGVDVAATESVALNGELGLYAEKISPAQYYYAKGGVSWKPGGGFKSGLDGELYSNGGYSLTFSASKDFE